VWISNRDETLIVDVALAAEYRDLLNHSGKYENVKIEHHPLISLTPDTPVDRIIGQYVKARGCFKNSRKAFVAAGKVFPCGGYAPYNGEKADTFEVIGYFYEFDDGHRCVPKLHIIDYKQIYEEQKP
jgi:hypothetical protein